MSADEKAAWAPSFHFAKGEADSAAENFQDQDQDAGLAAKTTD
jgi:hypothetical protein